MNSSPMQAVRGRLDRLVQHIEEDLRANCRGNHVQLKVSVNCVCGQEFQYRTSSIT
jgi:hypothetical protein